jgi:hypothetical protein
VTGRGTAAGLVKPGFPVPKTVVSATAVTASSQRGRRASRTRVRNQRRTTRLVTGFCDRHRHGTPGRLRPRLHHRPAATPPSRRARARRLLPGETASGACTDRPVLGQVLDQLRPGDTLVVWKLDRLGRSLRHLVDTVTCLAERGIGFRSLQESIDTTTPGGKLVFHVFAACCIVAGKSTGSAPARWPMPYARHHHGDPFSARVLAGWPLQSPGPRQHALRQNPASEAGGRVGVYPGLLRRPHRRSLTGAATPRPASLARAYPVVPVTNLTARVRVHPSSVGPSHGWLRRINGAWACSR